MATSKVHQLAEEAALRLARLEHRLATDSASHQDDRLAREQVLDHCRGSLCKGSICLASTREIDVDISHAKGSRQAISGTNESVYRYHSIYTQPRRLSDNFGKTRKMLTIATCRSDGPRAIMTECIEWLFRNRRL